MNYDFKKIEEKWQGIWEKEHTFDAHEDYSKQKYFVMVEFPYPSGDGLHVGHVRSYTALDVVARLKRLQGFNVLYPIGYDAFGLPTEKYAIKHKMNPRVVSDRNISNFSRQMHRVGISFSWNREISTCDAEYYKWTQWIFIQLFKKGLAYKKETEINWCPECKIGLANEEVVNGCCERCGTPVEKRVKNQWMLKITEYADRLIKDLDDVDYLDKIKQQQINWIGKSVGAEVDFTSSLGDKIKVFTTRIDTIYGATYVVISPDHPLLKQWENEIKNIESVKKYIDDSKKKSDFEKSELNKDKTGIELEGVYAINPVNNKEIPIYVSDYCLISYGTGALMAVPAHDTRDYEFAKKYNLPIIEVIKGGDITKEAYTDTENGILVNSEEFNGLSVDDAKEKILDKLEKQNLANKKINFKLRDWVFSRQRYWGEPIPMVNCDGKWFPLDEKDLPLTLPEVEYYEPTETGESPLANIDSFVNVDIDGKKCIRETDTMPQWAGSSWYFLRYTDPHNDNALADPEKLKYWLPVDWYNGGMEHTTLHLLYSRFWYKFLYDIGVVPTKEPYLKRTSHGMLLGDNGEKMSKSKGNVVNPDDVINEYGADTLRMYEMFMGDYEKSAPWNDKGINGSKKFIERVIRLEDMLIEGDEIRKDLLSIFHKTIKKVTYDYLNMKYNTAIAQMMTLVNEIYLTGKINKKEYTILLTLLNPVIPHITEELNERLGNKKISDSSWPEYDEKLTIDDSVDIPVQINGKLLKTIKVSRNINKDEILNLAKNDEEIASKIKGKNIVKEIYVPEKIINFVVK